MFDRVAGVAIALTVAACSSTSASSPDAPACAAPTGFETPVATGSASAPAGVVDTSLAITAYDEPQVAYVGLAGGDNSASQLYFTMWDRGSCTWRAPIAIDTVGDVTHATDSSAYPREVSLARDAATGNLAIAYLRLRVAGGVTFQDVYLAESQDTGMTWTTEMVATAQASDASDNLDSPVLGYVDNRIFIAYFKANSPDDYARCGQNQCDAIRLASRIGLAGAFTDIVVPPTTTGLSHATLPVPAAIAIDPDLNPGVAWADSTDTGVAIAYYYGGSASQTAFGDGIAGGTTAVALLYDEDVPHVAAISQRQATPSDHDVWFALGNDITGASWMSPVRITADEPDVMSGWLALAVDSEHDLSLATDFAAISATSTATAMCGGPTLSSSNNGVVWTTCGADPTGALGFAGDYVDLAAQFTTKRMMAFAYSTSGTAATTVTPGLVVWREP